MGGPPIRHEPIVHGVLLQDQDCEPVFRNSGWMDYFLKFTEFNEEIVRQFTHTVSNGEAHVKGLRVVATEERIVEVTGLPIEGEKYSDSKDARNKKAEFTRPGDPPLVVDRQGARRESLSPEWRAVALYVLKYLTCKGRFSCLHSHHFKLLSHMCHVRRMNVPRLLYNLLSISATETQKGRPHFVSHHCLIKILVEKFLRDVSPMLWNEFVETRMFRVEHIVIEEPLPSQEQENLVEPSSPLEPSSSLKSSEQNLPATKEPLQKGAEAGVPPQGSIKTRAST